MDRYDTWYGRGCLAHREQVLDVVADYRYFAPAMLAMDEAYAQLRAEATRNRQLTFAGTPARTGSRVAGLRRHLGAMLIGLGAHLRPGDTDPGEAATGAIAG